MSKNTLHECFKCQQELNCLPYHSYAEPPTLKSKEGQFYCFDCFKSISRCKVCNEPVAKLEINIHDKKTWYQPWEKIYWREAENSEPFDMCGRYCDFFCSPECLANDENRNHELRTSRNQEKLQQGWEYCEECVEMFEKKDEENCKLAISNHANVVPTGEKICKFHKRCQKKDSYIEKVIRPKAQKYWDSLSYQEKLAEVKRLDIRWIAAEKRKASFEEVASQKEVPPFVISQEFEHKEPCTSCGKTWNTVAEINCGKNSPNGKASYCASCPSSPNDSKNHVENKANYGDSTAEIDQIKKYFLANSVSKITLVNDNLLIEHQDETKQMIPVNNQELSNLHKFIQNKPNQSLLLSELQTSTDSSILPKNSNNTLVISLIISVVILIGIMTVCLLSRQKKNKH